MPIDIQDRIANLRLKIAAQEKEIILLEHECQAIASDLADFEDRYNRLIKPLSDQIDAAKSALDKMRDLLFQQQAGDDRQTIEDLWRDTPSPASERYIPPHERDFTISEPIEPAPKAAEPKSIKKLYRQLARQYHPDLATDEADRERRTKIMSLINNAYQEGDLEALKTLNEATSEQKTTVVDSQMPLDVMRLRSLQQQYHDLAVQIRDLKEKRHNLLYGHMMELKLEESIAKSHGENLLESLADDLQTEYWRHIQELDVLRQQVR